MDISKKLLESIIDKMPPEETDLAEYLYKTLGKLREIRNWLAEIRQKRTELEEDLLRNRKLLEENAGRIMAMCPHYTTTFYGDPAGGSDSHTNCDWCGKVL
jgi:hypothetical protein